ncbi:MAG: biphenyl 2,3-dioxygenase [Actinobacteria bacterium]|nr:biphenyl 2,3-dioxygenase [Actinomycetota bacterium]
MAPNASTSPVKLAHVVLRTCNYDDLLSWWKLVLNAEVRYENDFITFLSFDDEHHRIAIVKMPHLQDAAKDTVGLEHFAFTFADLDLLLAKYEQLKSARITPYWTVNHGMTLSAYYRDPDGNQVELQVDTMSLTEANAFMSSPVFAANPIGINVDFDELVARRRSGEQVTAITAYKPRTESA